MTKYSEAEMEEAKYEIWIMDGGRERLQAKHDALAMASIEDLKSKGYEVVKISKVNDYDLNLFKLVVLKGDTALVLRWCTGNKGWMQSSPSGGFYLFKA